MNPGSIPCPNCGAAWDEPCAVDCAPHIQDVDERATHLAGGIENRLPAGVPSSLVNALPCIPDGLGFE